MNDTQEYIRSLLASLEEVQRDAECMAEIIINKHPDTWDYDCNDCTCPACTTARKYRRVEG